MKFDVSALSAMSRENGHQAFTDTLKEIKDATLPMMRNYQAIMEADAGIMKLAVESNRAIGGAPNKPWPAAVSALLERYLAQESAVFDLIDKVVPKDIEVEGADARTAQVAIYIDTLNYFSTYARKLALVEVDVAARAKKLDVTFVLTAAERQEIVKGFGTFRATYESMDIQSKEDITKIVMETPDYVLADADIDAMHATYGKKKGSPLAQGFISADWNPIFKVRSYFNDRRIKRYHIAKEERQNLEFTIQVLKDNLEGEENPELQRELDYQTGRLKRLNTELKRIEDKAK